MKPTDTPPGSLEQALEDAADRAREATDRRQRAGEPEARERRESVEQVASGARDSLLVAPRVLILRLMAACCATLELAQLAIAVVWLTSAPITAGIAASQLAGKSAVVAALCVLIVSDARRFGPLSWLALIAETVAGLVLALAAIFDHFDDDRSATLWPFDVPRWTHEPALVLAAALVAAVFLLTWGWARVVRARHGLRALSRTEDAIVRTAAEAVAPGAVIPSDQLAATVDRYMSLLTRTQRSPMRWDIVLAGFGPLLRIRLPLPLLAVDARREHLNRASEERHRAGTLLRLVRLAYYTDARADEEIGRGERLRSIEVRPGAASAPPLRTAAPEGELTTDVVVVGGGAAGTTLALGLCERGFETVLVERGQTTGPLDPLAPDAEDFARCYADGARALVRGRGPGLTRAVAIGGGTAVSRERMVAAPATFWTASMLAEEAEIVAAAEERVAANSTPLASYGVLGKGLAAIEAPASRMRVLVPHPARLWHRLAGRRGLRIIGGFAVDRIEHADGAVSGVAGHLPGGRTLRVRAGTVILATGAPCSAELLRDSGLQPPGLGERRSWVVGARLLGEFDRRLDAAELREPSWILSDDLVELAPELHPPAVEALLLQAPRAEHDRLMRRWRSLAGVTVLTAVDGAKDDRGLALTPDVAERLSQGLVLAGQALLSAGAASVIAPTPRFFRYDGKRDLEDLRAATSQPAGLRLAAAYPLGGVPMGDDPATTAVDKGFRVRGTRNLYVCDGSVLPRSPGVDPQLTIMTLAELGLGVITAGLQRPGTPTADGLSG